MDTAVVVVNYRTPQLARAAVASVLSEPGVQEVVVVDNASGDGSVAELGDTFAADARVRVIASPENVGFGPGVNLGVAACRSPLVLILNSDATLVPGSLPVLAEALLADDRVGVVAPAIYGPDGRTLQRAVHGRLPRRGEIIVLSLGRRSVDESSPEWVSGVALLVRRADFVAVGGFDVRFGMYFEDVDLCRRLRERGKVARRQPAAGVRHDGGRSWRTRAEQVRRFHDSKLVYARTLGAGRVEQACVELLGRIRVRQAQVSAPSAARRP